MSRPFPQDTLNPRQETQALAFSQTYYNGKDVIIGILDTGIDPAAEGLCNQVDGSPKLLNVVDCTGSGDIDVSAEVKAKRVEKEGHGFVWTVEGLSGKTLIFPGDWKLHAFPKCENVESKMNDEKTVDTAEKDEGTHSGLNDTAFVRLGIFRAYDLFPKALVSRIKAHRREDLQKALSPKIAEVRQRLADIKAITKPTPDQVLDRKDMEARLATLQAIHEDPGPLYDCLVYFDGANYRAALSDMGLFDRSMASFDVDREFATFSTLDQYTYCVNFYNGGTILNICADAGAHASHVAAIAAHNEHGVAPSARIISFKIGDSRLGSMETGTSIMRALTEAIRLKVDIINLSYGEGCCVANTGRIIEMAKELMYQHNILFVASAGNNGPALSTVGAPGGTSTPCFGIAAAVSPAMREADYSLLLEGGESDATFTWSSVGPTHDGDLGVNLTAPGGAITSVPRWCLQKSQLMNGTSMSSPHAAGCIALLLSACKAQGIAYTPSRIQKALENTALQIEGLTPLQQGWGMIQVEKAWEYIQAHASLETEDLHFDVCMENRAGNPRGVYLRQPDECQRQQTFSVSVSPLYRKEDTSEEAQQLKCNLEIKFRLVSTASWVQAPSFFLLIHNGRSFKIDVDPSQLKPGLHTAKIMAFDTDHPERGFLFSIPITVAKPEKEEATLKFDHLTFEPCEVKRFFVSVPLGATWMDVTLQDVRSDDNDSSSRMIVLHALQLLAHSAYHGAHSRKYYDLMPAETKVVSLKVHGGITCEIAVARNWNTIGLTSLNVQVDFRGVTSFPNEIQFTSGGLNDCVRLLSNVRNEYINPSAKLTRWSTPIRPKADGGFVLSPLLDDRDIMPDTNKRIYELILTYEFTQEESGSILTRAPSLQGVLYESAYESQLILLFDRQKKYLGVADAWPDEIKVPKGTITLRMQVRHDKPEMLEKLKDTPIWIERKLEKEISLSMYTSKESMMIGSETFKRRLLPKGSSCSLFISEPPTSKLPSASKAGDILTGIVTFESNDSTLPGEGKRPDGFPLTYYLASKPAKNKDPISSVEEKDERSMEQKLEESIRDCRVKFLGKMTKEEKDSGKYDEMYVTLVKEYDGYLPLLLEGLKYLDNEKKRKEHLDKIILAADDIISRISEDELAVHFGKHYDKDNTNAVKEHKDLIEKKTILCEAWARKARALADLDQEKEFKEALVALQKWAVVTKEDKYALLVLERDRRAKRYGSMIKVLNSLINSSTSSDSAKEGSCPLTPNELISKRIEVYKALEYTPLVLYEEAWRVISAPKSYKLF